MHGSNATPAQVVIIDDHSVLAGALRTAVNTSPDLRVVATASSLAEGREAVRRHAPDIVLTDYRLPDGDIVDQLDELLELSPESKFLVFTGWVDEHSLVRSIGAGASGYLDKGQGLDDLMQAMRRVLAGELVVAPQFLSVLARRLGPSGDQDRDLSDRELEVLRLLADGRTTREIATDLHLSVNTIRNHVARLLNKLGAHSRLDAVRIGVERGLVRLDSGPR